MWKAWLCLPHLALLVLLSACFHVRPSSAQESRLEARRMARTRTKLMLNDRFADELPMPGLHHIAESVVHDDSPATAAEDSPMAVSGHADSSMSHLDATALDDGDDESAASWAHDATSPDDGDDESAASWAHDATSPDDGDDESATSRAHDATSPQHADPASSSRRILVTGCAGFIGMHVSEVLLARGDEVVCVDNVNDYYDTKLKYDRLARLQPHANFRFHKMDIADRGDLLGLVADHAFDGIVHLAAQAGVRYSLTHPEAYVDSNLVGFGNILEAARHARTVKHLVYASSSSVYGGNVKLPFSERDPVDHPVSLYAATKRANELMAHTYSHLYGLPTTGLRFFTVYGPWGRPDMSLFMFTKAILEGKPIEVFNGGRMVRDFTFIDDIVQGIVRVLDRPAAADNAVDPATVPADRSATAPFRVFNIGNSDPVQLETFISAIERATGRTAHRELKPMQDGDVQATHADTSALHAWTGFKPGTAVEDGITRFVSWYRGYYNI